MTTTTRILLIICTLLLMPALAGASWMGNFQLAHDPGSYLPHGEHAAITFDYDNDVAAGVRFRVAPMNGTTVMGGFVWSGSSLYGVGSGSLTTWWSYNIDAEVTHYRIQMVSADWTTTLLEVVIPAWYTFGANAVYNVQFNHTSPSWLERGHQLFTSFDGMTDDPQGAWVFARPFTNGSLSPGYGALTGFIPPGGGSDSHYIRFPTIDADVDEIRIWMYNYANDTQLLEFFVPVEFHWRDHGFADLTLDPAPPALLPYGQAVTASYTYLTTEAADIRTWAVPFLNDGWLFDGWYMGSVLLPPPSGAVARTMGITAPGTFMNQVAILLNDAGGTRIFEQTVPAEYTYADHALWNPVWDITSPAVLDNNERVTVDLEYSTTEAGGVRIYCWPLRDGGTTIGVNPSPLYPVGSGTAQVFFTVVVGASHVHDLSITMKTADNTTTIAEIILPADHFFAEPGFATPVEETPDAPVLAANWPNPFNPQTNIAVVLPTTSSVRLEIFDLGGSLVRSLHEGTLAEGRTVFTWNGLDSFGSPVASGTYLYQLTTPEGRESRRMVLLR